MDCRHCGHPSSEVHTNKDGITLRGAIFLSIGKQSTLTVKTLRTPPQPSHKGREYNVLLMWAQVGCNHSPPLWRARSLEEALNVLLCLVRGELSSSTRGHGKGEGPLGVDGSVSVLPLRPLREVTISM